MNCFGRRMKMKKMKSNLDERQEMQLLQIEHRGFWFAFWALVISLLIQTGMGIDGFRSIAGEFIVFMLLGIYMVIACIRNGIWDRKLKPTRKNNIIASTIAGAVVAGFHFFISYYRYQKLYGSIATAIIMFVSTMILCYILLSLSIKLYQRSVNKIERAIEDDLEK